MNRIAIALNVALAAAVLFLFYKVYNPEGPEEVPATAGAATVEEVKKQPELRPVGNVPTGKIAYVNIDRLNEESLEISDLVKESKRRKENIEGSMESLNMKYQNKVEEFQLLQKGGIAPRAELEAKAREIQGLEQEAQNKQLQMDQLTLDLNRKNENFQRTVRGVLQNWNQGRFDFILSYSEAVPTMLIGNAELEITDAIIAEVNKEYKQRKNSPAK